MENEIGHFLDFLSVEKGASSNTIAAYKNDLQQLGTYVLGLPTNGDRPLWCQVDRGALLDFILDNDKRTLAFCEACQFEPELPMRARTALPGATTGIWD